ncbi:unnamed protein product, partial [Scytosiphon promiscuus]
GKGSDEDNAHADSEAGGKAKAKGKTATPTAADTPPCRRCARLGLACTFVSDRSSFPSTSSLSTAPALDASSTANEDDQEVVFLEGGTEEGDWGELDFALQAVPIVDVDDETGEAKRREEPILCLSGRTGGRLPGDPGAASNVNLPWCRWVVASVGFSPPAGRPGKAQTAGLRRGDELTHLHAEPGARAAAGLLSRRGMDR